MATGRRWALAKKLAYPDLEAIMADPASGLYRGESDHRKDGAALGF